MRVVMVFVVGLMVGAVQVPFAQIQNQNQIVSMNHVGIRVPNIEEAITYYTQKMGYKVAFRGLNPQGGTQLVYMYISQNTSSSLGRQGKGSLPDSPTTACTCRTPRQPSTCSGCAA